MDVFIKVPGLQKINHLQNSVFIKHQTAQKELLRFQALRRQFFRQLIRHVFILY